MNTLEREPRLADAVTPLASPAFCAPAHPVVSATDTDDPAATVDESLPPRAEPPCAIPHVAPHGC